MGASQAPDAGAVPVWRSKFYIMIRIINQEEFKKCCEMCNSKDIESRHLGVSLMNECVEILSSNPFIETRVLGSPSPQIYHLIDYISKVINQPSYNYLGDILYNLTFYRVYRKPWITYKLIENDQSN